jgi:death-on-curing protein
VTYCLEVEAVIALNRQIVGAAAFLRDRGGLESALARPMHTSDGQDLYPTVIEKGAALLHGIATTQHFMDGNKRTAWMACVTFLASCELHLVSEADRYADEVVVQVAVGTMGQNQFALWLLEHLEDSK